MMGLSRTGEGKGRAYMVPRVMSSTNSANLSTVYKIKGMSYSRLRLLDQLPLHRECRGGDPAR